MFTKRFIFSVETVAALLLGLVVLVTIAEAVLRYAFDTSIPDAFTLSGYAQGIAIAWGIGSATYANRHINVDIVADALGDTGRRRMDIVATALSTVLLALMAWMLVRRTLRAHASFEMTNDLQWPVWWFLSVAAAGLVAATVFGLLRLVRLIRRQPIDATP